MTQAIETKKEAEQRRARIVISGLLRSGHSDEEMYELVKDEVRENGSRGLGLTKSQMRDIMYQIYAQWAAEDAEREPFQKSMATRRLSGHIRQAAKAGKWTAVAAMEKVLGMIQGTIDEGANIQINVGDRFTEAAIQKVSSLSPAQYREVIEKQRRLNAVNVTDQSEVETIP